MGTDADPQKEIAKHIPAPTAINDHIGYRLQQKRGHEVPINTLA